MSELAMVAAAHPSSSQLAPMPAEPAHEPVAEQNFGRRKLCQIEQGVERLQKNAREQHEVVANIESGMREMISEADLRRAIGLAFQEFDHRLEDAFLDSGRKCLAMFSKKDDVVSLAEQISKKVSSAELSAVLKKLSDLRLYVDTMANDIFIGHREALNGEFGKKADKQAMEAALAEKASVEQLHNLTDRVEKLEAFARACGGDQAAALEAMRSDLESKMKVMLEKLQVSMAESAAVLDQLRAEAAAQNSRLAAAEADSRSVAQQNAKLKAAQQAIEDQNEAAQALQANMQAQMSQMDAASQKASEDLMKLTANSMAFKQASEKSSRELSQQASAFKEQIEFLMQATDMIKRKARETNKNNTAKFADLVEEDARLREQLAGMDRSLKKFEREQRAVQREVQKALPAPEAPPDPNDHLVGVLAQLEAIAAGGDAGVGLKSGFVPGTAGTGYPALQTAQEPPSSKTERPPLPGYATGQTTPRGTDIEFALARLAGAASQTGIDSARGQQTAGGITSSPSPRTTKKR